MTFNAQSYAHFNSSAQNARQNVNNQQGKYSPDKQMKPNRNESVPIARKKRKYRSSIGL
jgi:hypothetical protein